MLKPKIGDTVVIRGVVTRFNTVGDCFEMTTKRYGVYTGMILIERIEEIIPAPPSPPVVGDMVMYSSCTRPEGRRLLFVHGLDAIVESTDGNTFTYGYAKLTKVDS